ncbi:hypothetical protein [Paenarthrobacter nicotinovorans]|uniref:hypothetical protein n=1 Tax=Paenarthrobacter nicotinovorans TaxID=29320 RepID=UPI00166C88E8|nr:hypothetical protein [Paenarthrobacter nicotinovorans]MBP2393014.1 hypothetical protein [Paenarthrobacter nicotinovorans]UKF00703.1 hypothetical protein LU808_07850 [Paenarthrobacter nicotinovorans]UKF05484.1 hypothetical protein JMY29_07875 [Paenarthrobacter nicotinovorans]
MSEGGGEAGAKAAAVDEVGGMPSTAESTRDGTTVKGAEAKAERDAWLPRWLVAHPLNAGWAWTLLWAGLIVLDELLDLAGWTWYLLVLVAALPTLISTLVVLHATPRSHLRAVDATVLGHFFVRFLALVAAFMVWAASVVMSASISTTVQSVIGDSEKEVTALGFNLMLAAVPLVLSVLWMAFIVRCAWFLRRLRGWRQVPVKTRVPKKFLRGRPRLKRVVVGLAHPGLLLVAGLGTSLLALFVDAVELTLNVLE